MSHPPSSPWAYQIPNRVRLARLPPGWGQARLAVPGSKSLSNRALLLAAWARGRSRLRGWLQADDTHWCLQAVRALGARAQVRGDVLEVVGHAGGVRLPAAPVYLGGSGTLARFLPGLLAASGRGGEVVLTASEQLCGRPMQPLLAALIALGARISPADAAGHLPWRMCFADGQAGRPAHGLAGGALVVDGQLSSQFVSGLMMAAPLARGPLRLVARPPVAQPDYLAMTAASMADFGAHIAPAAVATAAAAAQDDLAEVDGQAWQSTPQAYCGADLVLAADASTAAYFFALAAAAGGSVTVTNMPAAGDHQADQDILQVLARMGCQVGRVGTAVTVVGPRRLLGGWAKDMSRMADQVPTVAALAALADGPVQIVGVGHVRHHESDRIASMCTTLRLVGAAAEAHDDGLSIRPAAPLRAALLPTFGDHRIAMAWAPVAAATGLLTLDGAACVAKTCPNFFRLMARVSA